MKNISKVFRYSNIYGFRRTMIKAAGRLRNPIIKVLYPELLIKRSKQVSLIGCGQFGFSTISFFLLKKKKNVLLDCYDTVNSNSLSTAFFYGYNSRNSSIEVIENPQCKFIYIASNHYSHTEYATKALQHNKIVYVEKPISVNWEQFSLLLNFVKEYPGKLFVGYNRPFSAAIRSLKPYLQNKKFPITLSCFVIGHLIEKDHWYRIENEGTRICGNVGHWLDLMIHLMSMRGCIPDEFEVAVAYSADKDFDDNLSITITTNFKDLVNIILTGRSEPFEGINETINLQCDNVNVKIDDFRHMTLWEGEKLIKKKFKPKDVGHEAAILQPFSDAPYKRDFFEVEVSTVLMLSITDMVRALEKNRIVKPLEILNKLKSSLVETI